MKQKPLLIRAVGTLPYWWHAWLSGGTSRRALWLQAGCAVLVWMREES